MAQTVNVNFKLDSEVKKNMEIACADMGLTLSAAFTIFARKVGRERRIPFEVSADPFYSETAQEYCEREPLYSELLAAKRDVETKKGYRAYTSAKELFDDIP